MPRRPTYEKMIEDAILTLNERRGSSRQAIKKYLFETYKLDDIPGTYTRINTVIRKGIANGKFKYSKGPSSRIGLVKKPKHVDHDDNNGDNNDNDNENDNDKDNDKDNDNDHDKDNNNNESRSHVSPNHSDHD
ncbi:2341_t:CDS:2 [Gigaspora margarita]|uniref:Histone H1 n=1 Tax=Gigaspora margarita TaxID=4874 RepID=A0ABM8W6T6_GIGMA|nr:2341_t:CDS:2 [Gigaspora margarita]